MISGISCLETFVVFDIKVNSKNQFNQSQASSTNMCLTACLLGTVDDKNLYF